MSHSRIGLTERRMVGGVAGVSVTELTLAPEPAAVAHARSAVREALRETGDADLREAAVLAVSEFVTNAVVHAGTEVGIRIIANGAAVRVEIEDGNFHLPVRRTCSETSATGHGLKIVDEYVDRWSAARTDHGKVVWFEIGHLQMQRSPLVPVSSDPSPTAEITLLDVPLHKHLAWQEQVTTLLREHLLFTLDENCHALEEHAAASEALTILCEQMPTPQTGCARGPAGTESAVVVLRIPSTSMRLFDILDALLTRAVRAAEAGQLLGSPIHPEIPVVLEWLCGQISGQAGGAGPIPWLTSTAVRRTAC